MNILKPVVALAICLYYALNVSVAQDKWSLKKCINYAVEHNIQIKQKKLASQVSGNNLTKSKADALPDLNVGADYQYTMGRAVDPYTNEILEDNRKSNNFYLQSNLTIFQGFRTLNTIKRNKFDLMASLQDIEKAKNDVILNVAITYLDILFAKELHKVTQDELAVTKQQVDRTKLLVEAGRVAKGNLLEIQAQLEQEELKVINAENQLKLRYLDLTQLLELDSVGDFEIEYPQIDLAQNTGMLDPVQTIYQEALGNLPEIKSAELKLESSGKDIDIAKSYYSPRLTMRATYYTGYSDARSIYDTNNAFSVPIGYVGSMEGTPVYTEMYGTKDYPFSDQFKDNASKYITFTLTIPIFNRLDARTAVSNASVNYQISKNNLTLAKNQVYKDIQQAHTNAMSAKKKYDATEKAVTSTQEAFNYSQEKFNVGLINSVEYHTAKNQLTKIKSDLVQAKYEYVFRNIILDFYRGKALTFETKE